MTFGPPVIYKLYMLNLLRKYNSVYWVTQASNNSKSNFFSRTFFLQINGLQLSIIECLNSLFSQQTAKFRYSKFGFEVFLWNKFASNFYYSHLLSKVFQCVSWINSITSVRCYLNQQLYCLYNVVRKAEKRVMLEWTSKKLGPVHINDMQTTPHPPQKE